MMRRRSLWQCGLMAVIVAAGLAGCATGPRGASFEQTDLFLSGQEGYHTFRIPALTVTAKGTVLAFCEGRKNAGSDTGDIDLVLKRSTDGGRTWGPLQLVADDGPNTVGNPCPVVDRTTGTIWLPLTCNPGDLHERNVAAGLIGRTRTAWITYSNDDGVTWAPIRNITEAVKRPEWSWYATGPGCGIQMANGRLVIPCDHNEPMENKRASRSHVIYSDDQGASWQIGGVVGDLYNECQVVEQADGTLMLNMRNYAKAETRSNRRAIATSDDGGLTWSNVRYDATLVEPICQASFLRYTVQPKASRNRLLFANPASLQRRHMTVRLSYDEGETWPVAKLLHEGPTAYSALEIMPDGTIACFYEAGVANPYERITFARFSLEWLTDGDDSL